MILQSDARGARGRVPGRLPGVSAARRGSVMAPAGSRRSGARGAQGFVHHPDSKLAWRWCDDKVLLGSTLCSNSEREMPPLAPVTFKPMFFHHATEKLPCFPLLR